MVPRELTQMIRSCLDEKISNLENMKTTTADRMKAVRATMKAYKGDLSKITKQQMAETYVADANFLLREIVNYHN